MFKSRLTRTETPATAVKKYKVYTDGSILNNGQPGAVSASAALIENATGEQRFIVSYNQTQATSNRAELQAAIQALKYIKWASEFTIYSDSEYLVDGFNKRLDNWAVREQWLTKSNTKVVNRDLWEELYECKKFHKIKMIWVKSHNGDEKNEIVDALARKVVYNPEKFYNETKYLGKKLIYR
jgi:ribonuclease HI